MNTPSIVIYRLVVFLAAPSAMAGPAQEPPEVWQAFARKLEAGAFVRVRLKDGTQVKGHFILSSGAVLRLRPKTRISVPIRDCQFSDIELIDRQWEGWSPGRKVLTGVGVGLGVVGGVVLTLLALIDD